MMPNNFIFDFLWGIGLLILVILFYVITSGTFFPTLNFHEFKFQELPCFLKNLNLVYYYSISLTLHIFLSFSSIDLQSLGQNSFPLFPPFPAKQRGSDHFFFQSSPKSILKSLIN